ncbi:MAG: YraN family protein [Desulfurococcales archaeon]|nr:YraN family protein [Desulfurococcales archaeon]
MKPRRAWRSSEAIAASILEDLGFNIVELHKRISIEGFDVGEVDIIAERDGVYYAVEVKAGMADVSGVRQAYVNALLLSMKPMIVSRGIDEKALKLAEELGVEVITLPDLIIASVDELRDIVRDAMASIIYELLSVLNSCNLINEDDYIIINAIASTPTLHDAANTLGIGVNDVVKRISELRNKGVITGGKDYSSLRLQAMLLILCKIITNKK